MTKKLLIFVLIIYLSNSSRKANPPKRVSLPIPSYYEHIIASLDAQTLMLQEIEAMHMFFLIYSLY